MTLCALELCDLFHHTPPPKLFHLPKLKLYAHSVLIAYSFLTSAGNHCMTFGLAVLTTFRTSYKRNQLYLSSCIWLIFLSITPSRLFHLFHFVCDLSMCVHMCAVLLIYACAKSPEVDIKYLPLLFSILFLRQGLPFDQELVILVILAWQ